MVICYSDRSSLVTEGIGKASHWSLINVQDNVLFECHVIAVLPLDLSKCVPEFMLQALMRPMVLESFRNQVVAQSKTATMTTIGQRCRILKTDIILPPMDRAKNRFIDFVRPSSTNQKLQFKKH